MRYQNYETKQQIHAIIDMRKMPVETVGELDRLDNLERKIIDQLSAGLITLPEAKQLARGLRI